MTSDKIDILIKALIKAKGKFKTVEKTKENPYFKSKYADLGTINEAVITALHENGLTVIQTTEVSAGTPVLVTTLAHESGQFFSGQYPLLPTKNDPQAMGSALTYARRYALSAILTVVADDDDDGNASSQSHKSEGKASQSSQSSGPPSKPAGNVISEAQGRRLYAIWKNKNRQDDEVKEYIKTKYGFNSTKEITKDTYEEIVKWVESNEPASQPDPEPEIEQAPF